MRKFFSSFLAGLWLLAQAAQAQFVLTELNGFSSGGEDPTYSLTYLGNIVWSSGASFNGSIDIGATHSKKEVFLVCTVLGSTRTLTAASTTIGSTAVTKATTETATASGTRSMGFASIPTASGSQTITATYSGTLTAGVCGVFKVLNRPNRGNNQTDSDSGTCVSSTNCNVALTTINSNGLWFGSHYHANTNATTTPSGTTGVDQTNGGSRLQFAYRTIQGSSSTPNDNWQWSGTVNGAVNSWAFN